MKKSSWALHLVLLLVLLGCTKSDPGFHVAEYQETIIDEFSEDVTIPEKAWTVLEQKPPGFEDVAVRNIIFAPVEIFLVEKTKGIVEGEAVKISLRKGGGIIDLAKYISSKKGTFYVGFEFPSFQTANGKKVLFLSRTKKRRIGSQIYGSGCNQFFDISNKFFTGMSGEGIKVNTTQERYVSVLGGTYLFAAQADSDVYVAQVTFKHSGLTPLFCEEN